MSRYITAEETRQLAQSITGDDPSPGGNVLTVDEAAIRLSTSVLNVNRLIAIGVMPFTQLGVNGPKRLLATHLERYIAGGAPFYDMPPLDNANRFVDLRESGPVLAMTRKIESLIQATIDRKAVEAQIEQEAAKGRVTLGGYVSFPTAFRVPMSAAIRAACLEPLPAAQGSRDPEPYARFANVAQMYVVTWLRHLVQVELSRRVASTPRLYASKESFKEITAAARAKFTAREQAFYVTEHFARVDHRVEWYVATKDVLAIVDVDKAQQIAF